MNSGLATEYTVEPLAERHDRSHFHCGVEPLDRYLHRQAGQDARRRLAAPYVVVRHSDGFVAGYYTLSNTSVLLSELPPALARKLPQYPHIPATLLGRLAVDLTHRGRGVGEYLLCDALQRALKGSLITAAFALLVEAKDDSAARYYQNYGFQPLIDQPRRLFLPIKTIALLFP